MNEAILAITRPIDDGRPLYLPDPPGGLDFDGFAVDTAVCDNPHCRCTRMPLFARAIRFDDKGVGRFPGPELGGEVSSDGSGLKLDTTRTSTFTDELVAWLHDRICEPAHQRWLAERWRRLRGQIGDPAYPSPVTPKQTGLLVPFAKVFPWEFDLTVVHDHRKYLAVDHYCLEPRCTCDDVNVQFVDLMTSADPAPTLGIAKASLRSPKGASFDGKPLSASCGPRCSTSLVARSCAIDSSGCAKLQNVRSVCHQTRPHERHPVPAAPGKSTSGAVASSLLRSRPRGFAARHALLP